MSKIVLTSLINVSGTKAEVMIGKRHLATVFRAEGAWNAVTPSGTRVLPRVPHTVRDERGVLKGEISLGAIVKFLRETVEAKLAQLELPAAPTLPERAKAQYRF